MFGGYDNSSYMTQIQALPFKEEIKEQNQEEWRILAVQHDQFTPRCWFPACPLNETEIVIMGSNTPGDNKVFILNAETDQLEYIGEGGTVSSFRTYSNACVKVKENKVISLIRRKDTGPPAVIEFNKGDTNHILLCDI